MALHVVKLACELPKARSVPLSQWDCVELARKLIADKVVTTISRDTIRRILANNHLKPWRYKMWLSTKVVRDAVYAAAVRAIADLYTRLLAANEIVLSVDEKTNMQPRCRSTPTLGARPGDPVRLEFEYERAGALHLFAAFDTRSGKVTGLCSTNKRAEEFVSFLEHIDESTPATVTTIHLVLDNLRVHKSKRVNAWLAEHPRFQFHFPPVHCSWMNQVEQWFSILERKAIRIVDFLDLADLEDRILGYVRHWNEHAHPFNWTTASVAKVLAKCPAAEAVLAVT